MIWTYKEEDAALACAKEFEGTPHMQRRASPGKGVDCIQFVFCVLRSADMVGDFRWPSYRQTLGLGAERNRLADFISAVVDVESIAPVDWEPQAGDLTIWKVGRTANHCGVFVGGKVWHVTVARPVHSVSAGTVRNKLQEVLRLRSRGLIADPLKLDIQ